MRASFADDLLGKGYALCSSGLVDAPEPEASIVIVTRNRCNEVQRAVGSVLEQDARVETIVIDDCSEDETVESIISTFRTVRLYRSAWPRGYIECRNFAASVARAPIIVSIDDDARFEGVDTVRETLGDFDEDFVGAVAVPVADGDRVPATASPLGGPITVSCFRGTAYAVRTDVFLRIGGFRSIFVHQGEERDLALRMLGAGYVIRAGTASRPIRHSPSVSRDLRRMDFYGRRNDVLHGAFNIPLRYLPFYWARITVRGLLLGFRLRRPMRMVRGLVAGYVDSARYRDLRRPVSPNTYRLSRSLGAGTTLPLAELAPRIKNRCLPSVSGRE